jgi:hypothetical protein
VSELTGCEILGKAEFLNPGQSVKDRPARHMVLEAERRGDLGPGGLRPRFYKVCRRSRREGEVRVGVIEDRDSEGALRRTNIARIELVATPHPSLPLKGGGEESEAMSFSLNLLNRTAVGRARQ